MTSQYRVPDLDALQQAGERLEREAVEALEELGFVATHYSDEFMPRFVDNWIECDYPADGSVMRIKLSEGAVEFMFKTYHRGVGTSFHMPGTRWQRKPDFYAVVMQATRLAITGNNPSIVLSDWKRAAFPWFYDDDARIYAQEDGYVGDGLWLRGGVLNDEGR